MLNFSGRVMAFTTPSSRCFNPALPPFQSMSMKDIYKLIIYHISCGGTGNLQDRLRDCRSIFRVVIYLCQPSPYRSSIVAGANMSIIRVTVNLLSVIPMAGRLVDLLRSCTSNTLVSLLFFSFFAGLGFN